MLRTKDDLGNVGNPDTLVWLYCELCQHGKTLIRHGWRQGLPLDAAPIWVFCPLEKGRFPRDRKIVEACEKCPHYKGISHRMERMIEKKQKRDLTTLRFTKEELEQARKEQEEEERKWREEELM